MPIQNDARETLESNQAADTQSYQVVNQMLFETQGSIGAVAHNWRPIEKPCDDFLTDFEITSSSSTQRATIDKLSLGAAAAVSRLLVENGKSYVEPTAVDGKSVENALRQRGFERKPIGGS